MLPGRPRPQCPPLPRNRPALPQRGARRRRARVSKLSAAEPRGTEGAGHGPLSSFSSAWREVRKSCPNTPRSPPATVPGGRSHLPSLKSSSWTPAFSTVSTDRLQQQRQPQDSTTNATFQTVSSCQGRHLLRARLRRHRTKTRPVSFTLLHGKQAIHPQAGERWVKVPSHSMQSRQQSTWGAAARLLRKAPVLEQLQQLATATSLQSFCALA